MELLELIKEDLLTSWYFRIWLFFWIICGAVCFAAVVVFSTDNSFISGTTALDISIFNATVIAFPNVQLRYGSTEHGGNYIEDLSCIHNGKAVKHGACDGSGIASKHCFEVYGDRVLAENSFNLPQENRRIDCNITTRTDIHLNTEALLASVLDTEPYGPPGSLTYALRANEGIWIHVARSEALKNGKLKSVDWDPLLTYYTGVIFSPNNYQISFVIQTFKIMRYNEVPGTNIVEWENCAWVGGFFLFMWMIQALAMVLVGLFLDNTSQVLKGDIWRGPYTDYTEYSQNQPAGKKEGKDPFDGTTSADL